MTKINLNEVDEEEADELVDEIAKQQKRQQSKYGDKLEGSSLDGDDEDE